MVWIERYRPQRLEDILGQDPIVARLASWADTRTVPHLLVTGPHGVGKSVSVECLARRMYGETWEANTTTLLTAEMFEQGKSYLEADERFAHIYRRDESFITNFKYVVKWFASLQPLDAPFKLLVFEEAEALTLEAQQALRRIMERFNQTCRFFYCTTHRSALIPAITSRCYPLSFSLLPEALIRARLEEILTREKIDPARVTGDDLDLIVKAARGDLRRAIMRLQIYVESETRPDLEDLTRSEAAALAGSVFTFLRDGDLTSAQKTVESLLIDYGLTGAEVLGALSHTFQREYNDPRIAEWIGQTDLTLARNGNEFVQLNALLARILDGVFA